MIKNEKGILHCSNFVLIIIVYYMNEYHCQKRVKNSFVYEVITKVFFSTSRQDISYPILKDNLKWNIFCIFKLYCLVHFLFDTWLDD